MQRGRGAPLEGLRVVEGATFVAGPIGGLTLAQLGADVIRFDPIGGSADYGRWPLSSSGTSLYWTGLNKQKRSIALDLRSEQGQELVTALITAPGPDAGIFLTNTVGRGWLSDEALRASRDDLIHLRILGTPDGSPAVDYTVNAGVGFPAATGPRDGGTPVNHLLPAWDIAAGLLAAVGLLAAERRRTRTGEGDEVSIALSDVALAVTGHLGYLAEAELGLGTRPPDGNFLYGGFGTDFATADGRRVMVVAITARQWSALVEVTGAAAALEALAAATGVDLGDEGGRYELREAVAAVLRPWFHARDAREVRDLLRRRGVLCEEYRTFSELVRQPDYAPVSGLLSAIDQPGVGTYLAPGSPLRLGRAAQPPPLPAPRVGQDTADVLADVLGLSMHEIGRLHDAGVVGG